MKILNIGSMNLDFVYQVDHIVTPGETEAAREMQVFLGGKGINQSVALARAGAEVYHAGLVGMDGSPFLEACQQYGVNGEYIQMLDGKSGHAIIQLDRSAQNSILLYGGANRRFTREYVDEVLSHFSKGDILLLQNEINLLPHIVDCAFDRGMTIALNPSPYDENLLAVDMRKIRIFLVNEVEGAQMTGNTAPEKILDRMQLLYPEAQIVLTLGSGGSVYAHGQMRYAQPIYPVKAVDTTAAGDTFTGYFLAGLVRGLPISEILRQSAMAASIAVSRPGAVPSIPTLAETEAELAKMSRL